MDSLQLNGLNLGKSWVKNSNHAKFFMYLLQLGFIYSYCTVGNLDERKTEFYGEVYQIRQEMSACDYELHFKDKDSAEQNGVNGTGQGLK